jgi:hypothetical protein
MPSGRPIEDMDLAAAVSLARQALDSGDSVRARQALRHLLHLMDASVVRAEGPLMFDRTLVAEMLRYPGRYRQAAVLCQAALVQGTLGADTPMQTDPQIPARRRTDHQDNGA